MIKWGLIYEHSGVCYLLFLSENLLFKRQPWIEWRVLSLCAHTHQYAWLNHSLQKDYNIVVIFTFPQKTWSQNVFSLGMPLTT